MMVLSIINQKGGVGKTTTAINLAAGLGLKGKRVLLIDMDPQANATTGLGQAPDPNRGLYQILTDNVPIAEAMKETETAGVWLIPSHISLARRIGELDARTYREQLLRTRLAPVRDRFDYVVLDPPPALNILSINAVAASDRLIVPCKMDRYSLDGLGDLFETIEEVCEATPPITYRLLMTHYDGRNSRTNDVVEEELKPYREKGQVFELTIRKNEALTQAHIEGKSIFAFDKRSNGAEDYEKLTNEVLHL
jgi:chromosome partitioning protein